MSNKEFILKKGQKTAKIATIATILLALIKGVVGFFSGSILLIADAVHSAVDVLAIFSSWFGLKISQKKYSDKFPYGYYKAENFATLIASLFIFYAAYEIFVESYAKIFIPSSLDMPLIALAVPLMSSLVSYFIAVYEDRVGREIKSQSLIANAQESKADVLSSLVIFGGILLSYFNIRYVESVVGTGLSLMIVKIGYQNAKIAIYSLMDASLDKDLEKNIKKTILQIKNIKDVSNLKLRQSGLFIFGEISIKLLENINVKRAHDISDLIENEVKAKFSEIESLSIHVEPYTLDTMKILLPIIEDNGMRSEIVDHFGRAKHFLFVSVKDKKIISHYIKENIYTKEKIRAGLSSAKNILDEKVNVLLTKKIGEISFHTLRDNFVDIYTVKSNNANQAVIDFIENKLEKLERPTHLSDK
jgi:cation diffusion facilitator family transporter